MTEALLGSAMFVAGVWLLYACRYRAVGVQPRLLQSAAVLQTFAVAIVVLIAVGVLLTLKGILAG